MNTNIRIGKMPTLRTHMKTIVSMLRNCLDRLRSMFLKSTPMVSSVEEHPLAFDIGGENRMAPVYNKGWHPAPAMRDRRHKVDTSSAHDKLRLMTALDELFLQEALTVEVLHFQDPDPENYLGTFSYCNDPQFLVWLPAWIYRWDDKFLMKGMGRRDGGSTSDFEVYADGSMAVNNVYYKEWRYKSDGKSG